MPPGTAVAPHPMLVDSDTDTARPLGLWTAASLVVGHTIGVGIFLTPAELIGALASPALTLGLWIGCGVLVLAGALTFAELAARYPLAGGPYIYLRQAWGERIAFLYGWQALLVMDPGITAALALGLSQYLLVLWPAASGSEKLLALAAIWLIASLNMAGVTLSARVLGLLTGLKLLALAALVVTAFTVGDGSWSHFEPFAARRPGAPGLMEAMALGLVGAFFSFGGFWEASRIAGEVRDPGRTLPRALTLGIVVVTLAYVVTTVAFIYVVPAEQTTSAAAFARRAGEGMLGARGPSVLAAVVVLSVLASAMALVMMAPRLYVAMSRDRLFPSSLGAVSQASGAPARATGILAILASAYVLAGTFQQIVAFFLCTALSFVALAAAALLVIRRREPGATAFRAPGFPLTPVLFVLLVAAVVTLVAAARPLQALAGFVLVLPGVAVYNVLSRKR